MQTCKEIKFQLKQLSVSLCIGLHRPSSIGKAVASQAGRLVWVHVMFKSSRVLHRIVHVACLTFRQSTVLPKHGNGDIKLRYR